MADRRSQNPKCRSVHNFCDTRKPQGNTFETGMVYKVPSLAVDRAGREVLGNERLRHTAARKPPTVPPMDALAVQVYNARKEAFCSSIVLTVVSAAPDSIVSPLVSQSKRMRVNIVIADIAQNPKCKSVIFDMCSEDNVWPGREAVFSIRDGDTLSWLAYVFLKGYSKRKGARLAHAL
eukprot:gene23198-30413_t